MTTLADVDAQANGMSPRPDRVHAGSRIWSIWVADLVRAPRDNTGLGFPELRTPGGLLIILDGCIGADKMEFQWGHLTP